MTEKLGSWVVYLMTMKKIPAGMKAVCEQSEWDAMELARPGYHQLVQGDIGSEAEAEKVARGEPAVKVPSPRTKARRIWQPV